ncbi:MAG: Glyoxalase-like domain protein [Nevskia sp.]|nr:Glyoxalase-like domain protein [Nevskia sp.]
MKASTRESLGISKIGQIAVPVSDVARAEAFYRDVLGLKHLFTADGKLAFFDCGGTRLMLAPPENGQELKRGSILYFLVPEIAAAFGRLEAQGAKIVHAPHLIAKMPDHDLWMGFFEDSEGNTLALMAEVRA